MTLDSLKEMPPHHSPGPKGVCRRCVLLGIPGGKCITLSDKPEEELTAALAMVKTPLHLGLTGEAHNLTSMHELN